MNNIILLHPSFAAGAGDAPFMPSRLELASKLLLDTPLTSLASIATSPLPLPPEPTLSATTRLPRLNTLDSTCGTSRIPCLICCRRLSCSTGTRLALWGTTLKGWSRLRLQYVWTGWQYESVA